MLGKSAGIGADINGGYVATASVKPPDERNYSATRTEIARLVTVFRHGKVGQQHRVGAVAMNFGHVNFHLVP